MKKIHILKLFGYCILLLSLAVTSCELTQGYDEPVDDSDTPTDTTDDNPIIDVNLAKIKDASEMIDDGTGNPLKASFAGKYRDDLENHPGCIKRDSYDSNTGIWTPLLGANEATVAEGIPADIEGYNCAAKEYTVTEDTSKPIVILVHGNSDSPNCWEEWYLSIGPGGFAPGDGTGGIGTSTTTFSGFTFTVETTMRKQLASRLVEQGYRTIAVDFRIDRIAAQEGYSQVDNYYLNFDHGWAVPILQQLITAVIKNNPDRQISLVGHSLGSTIIRDAIRRNFVAFAEGKTGAVNPLPRIKDIVLLHPANHGVANYETNCGVYSSMQGTASCELGDRNDFTPTYFIKPLNGQDDAFVSPCGDGLHAYGGNALIENNIDSLCKDNTIQYTTITMKDAITSAGKLRDEFVTEDSAKLNSEYCENIVLGLDDYDPSGYYFGGRLANHYAAVRSEKGIETVISTLTD